MFKLTLLFLIIFLSACVNDPLKIYPPDKNDPVLRSQLVKDLSFYIRQNPYLSNETLYDIHWYGVEFTTDEKDIFIEKARKVNNVWDGK